MASAKRFAQIRESLLARGASAEALDRIQSPAGLDIGARTPEEIAVSVLAEIVQVRRSRDLPQALPSRPAGHRDPVCGMTVDATPSALFAELGGVTYFFCCGGCRERFLAAPERFLAAAGSGGAA